MKQLVNKYDSRFRLVGLTEARREGEYIRFRMPIAGREEECIWTGASWDIEDYEPQARGKKGEEPEFIAWLSSTMRRRGYSATGLSLCMGYSSSWMSNFLHGRSRLREKDVARLAEELGVSERTLRAKRQPSATIRKDV